MYDLGEWSVSKLPKYLESARITIPRISAFSKSPTYMSLTKLRIRGKSLRAKSTNARGGDSKSQRYHAGKGRRSQKETEPHHRQEENKDRNRDGASGEFTKEGVGSEGKWKNFARNYSFM